ncbi:MAG: undecaprenyl diphosphate synthase family protein [Myxococcales bacterium]|nr:undecaprenyl diphosphate synthase family protein [Myxococcales bacterium]
MQNARHIVVVMNGTARFAEERKRSLREAQEQSLCTARSIVRAAAAAKVRHVTLCGEQVELPSYPTGPGSPLGPSSPDRAPSAESAGRAQLAWLDRELVSPSEDLSVHLRLGQSGRRDIARAVQKLAKAVQAGHLDPTQLDETLLRTSLVTADLPDPDLIIYTGCRAGEHFLRDELIFESAYAEFFFSDRLWPEFAPADFMHALSDFASRQRRFGKTAEQLNASESTPSRYLVASSSIGT